MTSRYLSLTPDDARQMLQRIGVPDVDALFDSVPEPFRLREDLALPGGLDESALMAELRGLALKNRPVDPGKSFLGGGAYYHHIPPAVDQLLLRGEFYTAYTPYQAEVAQGTLQAMFEFQTLVCELFGLEIANASLYDGASGLAEAALMARRVTGKATVLVADTVHPHARETLRTYLDGLDDGHADIRILPSLESGQLNLDALDEALAAGGIAGVAVGYPNVLGCIEDLASVAERAHAAQALCISLTYEPYALSVLEAPGRLGVDIAVGEGQALATAPSFGGPGVGLFACREAFLRQMPGRLIGETVDVSGKRGYVLTLNTREQHIRREKATSNICTNNGLIALAMTIRCALLGQTGFKHAGELMAAKAVYLAEGLAGVPTLSLPYSAPFFNEFVLRSDRYPAESLVRKLQERTGIEGGIPLVRLGVDAPRDLLVAVTELQPKASLDAFIAGIKDLLT